MDNKGILWTAYANKFNSLDEKRQIPWKTEITKLTQENISDLIVLYVWKNYDCN